MYVRVYGQVRCCGWSNCLGDTFEYVVGESTPPKKDGAVTGSWLREFRVQVARGVAGYLQRSSFSFTD